MRWRGVELKTPEQLVAMRRAGLVVAQTHVALREAAAPGVTTGELDVLAREVLARHGATSSFLGYDGGYDDPPFPAVTCISVNEEIVHGIPGDRVLAAGDLVSVDFGAIVQILPGRDGLLHVSQIANERVNQVSDYLKEGQQVRVKAIEADDKGRLRLSMKAAAADEAAKAE